MTNLAAGPAEAVQSARVSMSDAADLDETLRGVSQLPDAVAEWLRRWGHELENTAVSETYSAAIAEAASAISAIAKELDSVVGGGVSGHRGGPGRSIPVPVASPEKLDCVQPPAPHVLGVPPALSPPERPAARTRKQEPVTPPPWAAALGGGPLVITRPSNPSGYPVRPPKPSPLLEEKPAHLAEAHPLPPLPGTVRLNRPGDPEPVRQRIPRPMAPRKLRRQLRRRARKAWRKAWLRYWTS